MQLGSFVGSIALVRHPQHGEESWLSLWDETRQFWRFVSAHRLEGESFREAIDREIAWDLNLRRNRDYVVSSVPRLHVHVPWTPPGTTDTTFLVVEFFVADLYGKAARESVAQNSRVRWMTGAELLSGIAEDGSEIDRVLVMLLRKSEVISAHPLS